MSGQLKVFYYDGHLYPADIIRYAGNWSHCLHLWFISAKPVSFL